MIWRVKSVVNYATQKSVYFVIGWFIAESTMLCLGSLGKWSYSCTMSINYVGIKYVMLQCVGSWCRLYKKVINHSIAAFRNKTNLSIIIVSDQSPCCYLDMSFDAYHVCWYMGFSSTRQLCQGIIYTAWEFILRHICDPIKGNESLVEITFS